MNLHPLLDRIALLRLTADYQGARNAARAAVAAVDLAQPADWVNPAEFAEVLIELGRLEEEFGDHGESEAALRWADSLARTMDIPIGRILRIRALTRLSVLLRFAGRPDDAADAADQATAIMPDVPSSQSEAAAMTEALIQAGFAAEHRGRTPRDVLARATETATLAGPGMQGHRARILASAAGAVAERRAGRYAEAAVRLGAAIDDAEITFGPWSLEMADLHSELGSVYQHVGRFDDAEPMFRRSIDILVAAFGTEEHPDVASLFHNLGGLALAAGRYVDAELPARRVVEIREATMGPEHLATAAGRSALASILDALGRTDEAAELRARTDVLDSSRAPVRPV